MTKPSLPPPTPSPHRTPVISPVSRPPHPAGPVALPPVVVIPKDGRGKPS